MIHSPPILKYNEKRIGCRLFRIRHLILTIIKIISILIRKINKKTGRQLRPSDKKGGKMRLT
ncbi:hypothetical protein BLX87_00385 [Bacillus sp. VT-16-64]|nr:hypothetical protein BLX87_00385 [Bacillus sp. VT-16-64]